MKKTNLLKMGFIALSITIFLILILIFFMIYSLNNVDLTGNYKDTFTTQDEEDTNFYNKFSPSVKIESIGDNYSVEVKLTSSRISSTISSNQIDAGTIDSYHYGPIEIPKSSVGRHHIFQFATLDNPDIYIFFCEIEYLNESHIKFRYAQTEGELTDQEFYTLPKLKYSSMGW